jgi:hypothetical protein
MPGHINRKPDPPPIEDPEELEPDSLPLETEEGMVPTYIPEDPERDRLVDPEDRQPSKAGGRAMCGNRHLLRTPPCPRRVTGAGMASA